MTFVPRYPNYQGSFDTASHTGPWRYLQNVPLVLYGPGFIEPEGVVEGPANVVDVFPTVGDLVDVDLPARDGRILDEALADRAEVPRLVVVVVWDGVGRNVLTRWPERWPTLARLETEGTSFLDATVGSSPSITAATHSNLGTGAWPRSHGITGNQFRARSGELTTAFDLGDPEALTVSTFADEVDQALDNRPLVGLLAWQPGTEILRGPRGWRSDHLGMLGHGTAWPGGDADHVGLLGERGDLTANPNLYSPLSELADPARLDREAGELDRVDGIVDDKWMDHDILTDHDNPAWAEYESALLMRLLHEHPYGRDDTPDLLFTNFKMTDRAGHNYSIDSEEMAIALHAQDAALGKLVAYLEREIQDFVVILTSDHGHTPSPERTGAWPISTGEMNADISAHFDLSPGESPIEGQTASGLFLDRAQAASNDITAVDIAEFLNGYTIEDNWSQDDELPAVYENKRHETVFSAAFASDQLDAIMRCRFGSTEPPKDIDA